MGGKGEKHEAAVMKWLIAVTILAIILAVNWPRGDATTTQPQTTAALDPMAAARLKKQAAKDAISLKNYTWSKSEFGVMTVNLTIQNPSDYDLKDVVVRCEHYAPSGTKIDSNERTIYDIVPARGAKSVRAFNMGFMHSQASSSSCGIRDSVVDTYRPAPEPKLEKTAAPVPTPPARPK